MDPRGGCVGGSQVGVYFVGVDNLISGSEGVRLKLGLTVKKSRLKFFIGSYESQVESIQDCSVDYVR